MNARQHPNIIATQKALLKLWKKDRGTIVQSAMGKDNDVKNAEKKQVIILDDSINLDQPLTYVDRMRFRKPNDNSFCLPPHMDSGSITRWSDPIYR